MNKLKAMNMAVNRYLSRFSRKQFFLAFSVITVANYWLAYNVPDHEFFYLAAIGGSFFGMMFVNFERYK